MCELELEVSNLFSETTHNLLAQTNTAMDVSGLTVESCPAIASQTWTYVDIRRDLNSLTEDQTSDSKNMSDFFLNDASLTGANVLAVKAFGDAFAEGTYTLTYKAGYAAVQT